LLRGLLSLQKEKGLQESFLTGEQYLPGNQLAFVDRLLEETFFKGIQILHVE